MAERSNILTKKLLDLMEETGYPLVQHNGQRKFGPPPGWVGPPPPKGSEIFIGKLPREIFEDELVPIFSRCGKIYEMRLMMDFSGSNRGYAFVTYTNKIDASRAVREINGFEIRKGRHIGIAKSVDNCRLFIGSIPKNKTKEDIHEELSKRVTGIVDVILYKNCYDRRVNRGFAFVEFVSHRAAAMARRALVPGCFKLWDQEINVDWAEPEPNVDEEEMQKVKALYARNFHVRTTPEIIKNIFEKAANCRIQRVKKIFDYAFIHFYERTHAELALQKLQNSSIDGHVIEVKWAKPVDRELYKIQKQTRGNAKYNNSNELTLLLYKQHVDQKEYDDSPKEDEGIGSGYGGGTPCCSPNGSAIPHHGYDSFNNAPIRLDSICKSYFWEPPKYQYQKHCDSQGVEFWIGQVVLNKVGQPLMASPVKIGPLMTGLCYSVQQAQVAAAECALGIIQMLRSDFHRALPAVSPIYPPIIPPVPGYLRLPYEYRPTTPVCHQLPVIPNIWRNF